MSKATRLGKAIALSGAFTLAISLGGFSQLANAQTSYDYTPIAQNQMKAVYASSVEPSEEAPNGPLEKVLDGDKNTYWHTKWGGGKDPLPHQFIIDLGKSVTNLGQVTLTPRQSSNGSGRVGQYQIGVSNDQACATAETLSSVTDWVSVAQGEIPAQPAGGKLADAVINFEQPVAARCVRVVYNSTWGGNDKAEEVATLAEFKAATATGQAQPVEPVGDGPAIVIPDGALTITDGELTVRTHPSFPQIVDYQLAGKQLAGNYGDALTTITINDKAEPVSVGAAAVSTDKTSVSYPITFNNLAGVSANAVISVKDGALTWRIQDIKDANKTISTIAVPQLNLVSLNSKDAASNIYAANPISDLAATNRASVNDTNVDIANSAEITKGDAWMIVASNSDLAAGFESNAIPMTGTDVRFNYSVKTIEGVKVGAVSPASWVYRSDAVRQYDDGTGIGVNDDPFISVKLTGDANNDKIVNWQDGAIVTRDILTPIIGSDDVKNYVVQRIPFNIVSQATHPFLRTLDDTKRVSLATDNLGQEVLLKGYQAEGHDSAQGDYGGNYNERAGGLKDLKTLVNEGENWNATFGIHVNATESYSEANCFADGTNGYKEDKVAAACELSMPPSKAWGWMNQAYYMNNQKDLATGNVLQRLAQLREDFPADSNLNWLYWDVYYASAWQADRFSTEMQQAENQGWRLSSEWAYAMPRYSTWSHWATDEGYGINKDPAQANKGLNSKLVRFVENSYRDTWNPDPMLSNANVVEFEGWTGQVNYGSFIQNVWQRNLPTKFLQQSDIMSWQDNKIIFENGTVVTSPLTSIDGKTIPTNREITYDGATVFSQGDYLLPWSDGGQDRLYYWNPGGEARDWQLTDSWAGQSSLKLYKLGDTGKVEVGDVAVKDGSVSLPATDADTAYVLYGASDLPDPVVPNWGQGSLISDPGFFSGTLDSYITSGDEVTITKTDRGNFQAQLGAGTNVSLGQQITVEEGDYSAWAWIEIQPGKSRALTVGVVGDGVKPAGAQAAVEGVPMTTIHSSPAKNATASDEKYQTRFQRVPVHFHSDGKTFTFVIQAGEGDATVAVDDLRIVKRDVPAQETAVANTIVFEDFEDVDTGYWPFVTGSTQGGDARTQLALRHEPYSQSGWYGVVNDSAKGLEGQKYTDNVLDGDWSLLAHQEKGGIILRTTEASVPLQRGHSYQVSFDYQSGFTNGYEFFLGHDEASDDSWSEISDQSWPIAMARGTGWKDENGNAGSGNAKFNQRFAVTADGPAFLGVRNLMGNVSQNDLVIDNFRVVDLGILPIPSLSGEAISSNDPALRKMKLTSTVSVPQGEATDIKQQIAVPQGWTLTPLTSAADKATADAPSVATWELAMPKNAEPNTVQLTASWVFEAKAGEGNASLAVDPGNFPLQNPIGGADLEIVSASSEQTSGEPAPNGPAAAAIDGDANTYWHTQWGPDVPYPHEIVLRPKAALEGCTITGFEYTARQNAANGRVKGYEIYVSADGENWGDAVAKGDLANVTTPQVIEFEQPAQGSFVKMVQLNAQNGLAFGGAAEIRLGGICGSPTQPSVEPSSQPSASAEPSTTTQPTDATSVTGEPSVKPADDVKDTKRVLKLPKTGATGALSAIAGISVVALTLVTFRRRR